MKLRRLEIQTLPGIQPGFAVDGLTEGAHIVVAPNAGGKSSLLRALRYLVAGAQPGDPPALALVAELDDGGTRRMVRRTGGSVVWEENGRASEPPPLPAADQLHCCWFAMEDLLAADARDEVFLAEIRRVLGGGYDLDAVRSAPAFEIRPRHGRTQATALQNARRKLREVGADYEALRREESDLPSLRKELGEARSLAVKTQPIVQALELLEAVEKLRAANKALEVFPAGLNLLRGDERERLAEIGEKQTELENEKAGLQAELDAAERALTEANLADGGPPGEELAARKQDIADALRIGDRIVEARGRRDDARIREQRARAELGGMDNPPRLSPDAVSQAETLAGKLQKITLRRDGLAAKINNDSEASTSSSSLTSAAEALRGWLAARNPAASAMTPALWLLAAAAVAGLAASLLAGAWMPAIPAAVVLLLAGWMLLRSRSDAAEVFRSRFRETGVAEPAAWEESAVSRRLNEIEAQRTAQAEAEHRAREAASLRRELEQVEKQLQALETEKETMAREFGFDPALTAAGLDRFIRLVSTMEEEGAKHQRAQAEITNLEQTASQHLGKVWEFLAAWKIAAGVEDDARTLEEKLNLLAGRADAAKAAIGKHDTARRGVERCDRELAQLREAANKLYKEVNVPAGDIRELERRCELFNEWKSKINSVREEKIREAQRRAPLENHPELLAFAEAGDRERLEAEKAEAERAAERAEELKDRIREIEIRADTTGADKRLEEAAAAERAAAEAVGDGLEQALFCDAAAFLLDGVRAEYRASHEPELLRDARALFARFTHHEFVLDVDAARGLFARDVRQDAVREITELSSGTRMQLLLAVRLAWTHRVERGRAVLPLFLDEALTTSDETRFAQVARALQDLVENENRQVFYLSARRHEAALWEHATGHAPQVIDLAAIRFGARRDDGSIPRFDLPPAATIPAPGGDPPERYAAKIGASGADPSGDAGMIHLFHLLRDDLVLLHGLMENWRVTTCGQLETLLASEAGDKAIPDAGARQRLPGRCVVARIWTRVWREGRGRSVDRIALETSGAVSNAFIDRVTELADLLGGDAEKIIAALRDNAVPRFRAASAEQLEEWFHEKGFLDPAPTLDADGRERRTLTEAAKHTTPEEVRQVVRWLEAAAEGS